MEKTKPKSSLPFGGKKAKPFTAKDAPAKAETKKTAAKPAKKSKS
jgi:hypothetical protein